jgi:hypothetical protein
LTVDLNLIVSHPLKALVPLVCSFPHRCLRNNTTIGLRESSGITDPEDSFPNSRWAIVLLDANGDIAGDMVLPLSSAPAREIIGVRRSYRNAEVTVASL